MNKNTINKATAALLRAEETLISARTLTYIELCDINGIGDKYANAILAHWENINNSAARRGRGQLKKSKADYVAALVEGLDVEETLEKDRMNCLIHMKDIKDVFPDPSSVISPVRLTEEEYKSLSEEAQETFIKQHRLEVAEYKVAQSYYDWARRLTVVNKFIKDPEKIVAQSLLSLLNPLVSSHRDVVPMSTLRGIARIFDGNTNKGLAAVSVLENIGLVSISMQGITRQNDDGETYNAKERVFTIKHPKILAEMQYLDYTTSDRAVITAEPRLKESIINNRDYRFTQDGEGIVDVAQYMSSIPLNLAQDFDELKLEHQVGEEIKDEDGNIDFNVSWKKRVLQLEMIDYERIREAGFFYQSKFSDFAGRLYGKTNFGVERGERFRQYVEFKEGEVLNEVGKAAMRQEIVNHYGYKPDGKKPTEEQAEEFFAANAFTLAKDSKTSRLVKIYMLKESTGHMVEVDAQTQGSAIMGALLLRDTRTAYLTGLLGTTERTDMYQLLANGLNSRCSVTAWTRNNCKTALMTKNYGAGYATIMFGSGKQASFDFDTGGYNIHAGSKKAIPLMATAEEANITDTKLVWTAYKKTMQNIAGKPLALQDFLSAIQKRLDKEYIQFKMPDGVEVTIASYESIEVPIHFTGNDNKVHSVTMHERTLVKKATSLAPRFVQAIDAYILRIVVRKMKAAGLPIQTNHDGYMTHANHIARMQQFYREANAQVMEENLLAKLLIDLLSDSEFLEDRDVLKEVQANPDNVYKLFHTRAEIAEGLLTSEDILNSKYALWY
jgi:hypothetical protein